MAHSLAKTVAKSYPHHTGTTLHVVFRQKGRKVEICVWEGPDGQLVALDNTWMAAHQDANTDPVPELMRVYGRADGSRG